MKTRTLIFTGASVLVLVPFLQAQKSTSDLQPPQRRQSTVETAERLTRPPVPAVVPEDLPQPFNPAGFDLPDGVAAPAPGQKAPPAGAVVPPAGPASDREILETLAGRLPNASSANFKGKPLLIVGTNRLQVGQSFIVTDPRDGKDYELELIAIGTTNFTVRYRNEQFTRPNRPTK